MQSNRIFYYDALRALAIIGIVSCHSAMVFVINGINSPDFFISAIFDCLRDFSIPVFVMLSGALLINRRDSFEKFFKKRLSRIFTPFLFWVLIYIAYSSIFITHGFDLGKSIDIFFGTSGTIGVALWFIWMIVILYIGIFIINRIIAFGLKRYDSFDVKFINILTLMSLIYFLIVTFGLFNPYPSKITYFISFISYGIIGYFIVGRDYLSSRVSSDRLAVAAGILFISSYLLYIFSYVVPMSQLSGHFVVLGYFNVKILFISLSFFLFFKFLSKSSRFKSVEESSLGKVITQISRYSFGIYLIHYLILHMLRVNLARYIDFLNQSPLIWIPVLIVTVLVISLVVLKIFDRISYLERFTGNN
jgi:surface polysaccharide O-acyltransferase-like enzyme